MGDFLESRACLEVMRDTATLKTPSELPVLSPPRVPDRAPEKIAGSGSGTQLSGPGSDLLA